ncbi:hypothetical protein GC173_18370 [bacterium]|nr:hypothetical protein [bacterium]
MTSKASRPDGAAMGLLLTAGLAVPWKKRLVMEAGLRVVALKGVARRLLGERPGELSPDRIVVFLFTRAGDLVSATPFLQLLQRRWPDAPITLVVYREVEQVALGVPGVRSVVAINRRDGLAALRQLWKARGTARTLVLTHSINPLVALFALLSPAGAWAGYLWDRTYRRLPGHRLEFTPLAKPFDHLVRQHTVISEALGIDSAPLPEIAWSYSEAGLRAPFRELMTKLRGSGKRLIVVSAGSRHANRTWPIEHWDELVDRLAALPDVHILAPGAPTEASVAEAFQSRHPGVVTSLAGNTNFHEFAATVEAADLVIGNDSAASHLAAVFKRPCIAFFGPVPPELRDHKRPGHVFHGLAGEHPCRCGYDFFREATACPHGRQCLTSITVERAFATAVDILSKGAC